MFEQQPFRLDPAMPVGAYKSYSVKLPPDTWVKSACEDVLCDRWQLGWTTTLDESTADGAILAGLVRRSGRTFKEQRTGEGVTVFTFEPGQRCFAEHRTRPELHIVRDGDWRGNPTGRRRVHATAADWVEDFGEHQQRVADQTERG